MGAFLKNKQKCKQTADGILYICLLLRKYKTNMSLLTSDQVSEIEFPSSQNQPKNWAYRQVEQGLFQKLGKK